MANTRPWARRMAITTAPTSSIATPETAALAGTLSAAEIHALKRGGHDARKLYAAFAAARAHRGRPTVILAKTKKATAWGLPANRA